MLLKISFMFTTFLGAVNDGISQRSPQGNHDSHDLPPSHRHPNLKTAWKPHKAVQYTNTSTLNPYDNRSVEVNFHL